VPLPSLFQALEQLVQSGEIISPTFEVTDPDDHVSIF